MSLSNSRFYGRNFSTFITTKEERVAAVRAGRMWYSRLSKLLNHELTSRQLVVLYADHPNLHGTSGIPGYIGRTTGSD